MRFNRWLVLLVLLTLASGCVRSGNSGRNVADDSGTASHASEVGAIAVLGAVAVPVGVASLPYMALSALRGEDIGLSELGLREKYGAPTTVFFCANDYFRLWHYHSDEGKNKDVYFFIFNDGYVQDVQFVNKWEPLCEVAETGDN